MDAYDVLDKIGHGAFGEVFRARRVTTGEMVAIKKLRLNDDGRLRVLPAALFQEIETLRQLDHVHIVKLLDVVADGTHVALVMEYVETDLFSVIRQRKEDFTDAEIRCILRMLLQAVAFCHDHHILHRDIKPGNLLVSRSGELKLSDFGLATVYVGSTKSYSHQVATRWYRAPELLLGARQYDGAVDMWAVGTVLAELLHLVPLFPGQSDIDQLLRIFQVIGHPETSWPEVTQLPDASKVEFPPYTALPWIRVFPDASPAVLDLLSKLLVLDPTRRLSAREALNHPFFFSGAVAPRVPEERVYSAVQRSANQHNRDATHGDAFLNSLGKPLRPPCA